MANNRLYIYDTKTNESIMIAKGYGDGWYSLGGLEGGLDDFFEKNDVRGSYGEKSSLVLMTEAEHDEILSKSKRTVYTNMCGVEEEHGEVSKD